MILCKLPPRIKDNYYLSNYAEDIYTPFTKLETFFLGLNGGYLEPPPEGHGDNIAKALKSVLAITTYNTLGINERLKFFESKLTDYKNLVTIKQTA